MIDLLAAHMESSAEQTYSHPCIMIIMPSFAKPKLLWNKSRESARSKDHSLCLRRRMNKQQKWNRRGSRDRLMAYGMASDGMANDGTVWWF